MTPKEKAQELFKKQYQLIWNIDLGLNVDKDAERYEAAKQCALIVVDEVVKQLEQYGYYKSLMTYWDAVKQEIEKL